MLDAFHTLLSQTSERGGFRIRSREFLAALASSLAETDDWFLALAEHEGTPVVGLPGNPISAMVTFEVLVAPCLRKMLGDPSPHPQPIAARLAHGYQRRPGRVEIARALATREGDEVIVTLASQQGSGSLPSFVGVNALVILPADKAELHAGDQVETILWGPGLRGAGSFFDTLD